MAERPAVTGIVAGRNFQETVFQIKAEDWPLLLQLIVENNPQLDPLLSSLVEQPAALRATDQEAVNS